MKTLAVFSLSCFFLFFAGVSGWAQVLVPDCDTSVFGLSLARLQEEMHCLNKALESQAESNENRLGDILELHDKLEQPNSVSTQLNSVSTPPKAGLKCWKTCSPGWSLLLWRRGRLPPAKTKTYSHQAQGSV